MKLSTTKVFILFFSYASPLLRYFHSRHEYIFTSPVWQCLICMIFSKTVSFFKNIAQAKILDHKLIYKKGFNTKKKKKSPCLRYFGARYAHIFTPPVRQCLISMIIFRTVSFSKIQLKLKLYIVKLSTISLLIWFFSLRIPMLKIFPFTICTHFHSISVVVSYFSKTISFFKNIAQTKIVDHKIIYKKDLNTFFFAKDRHS